MKPDIHFSLAAMIVFGIGLLSHDRAITVIATALGLGLVVAKAVHDNEPLNRAKGEVQKTKKILDDYSSELYQQAIATVRTQIETSLIERIKALTKAGHYVRLDLDSNRLQRQVQARKLMPEVMSTLLKARATYRDFTGLEAPGMDDLDILRAPAIQGGPLPDDGPKPGTQPGSEATSPPTK